MKLRIRLLSLLIMLLVFAGCGKGTESGYTFKAVNDLEMITGTSQLVNILDFRGDYLRDCATLQGQLLAVFGEPAYTTLDFENAWCYIITARDKDGNEWIFDVYCGASGPAIGGDESVPGIKDAANELIKYVRSAEPQDFVYAGYYLDTDSKIELKVENGKSSYSETQISEAEWEEVFEELYGSLLRD